MAEPEKELRSIANTNAIVITVDGGLIQDIDNIPPGIEIEVWDFDVEGCDEDELEKNVYGEEFNQSYYGGQLFTCVLIVDGKVKNTFVHYSLPKVLRHARNCVLDGELLDKSYFNNFSIGVYGQSGYEYTNPGMVLNWLNDRKKLLPEN